MATTVFGNGQALARPAGGKVRVTTEQFLNWLQGADTNGDGKISMHELSKALKQLGIKFTSLRAWCAVQKADLNDNDLIDSDLEIMILMKYAAKNWGIIVTDE